MLPRVIVPLILHKPHFHKWMLAHLWNLGKKATSLPVKSKASTSRRDGKDSWIATHHSFLILSHWIASWLKGNFLDCTTGVFKRIVKYPTRIVNEYSIYMREREGNILRCTGCNLSAWSFIILCDIAYPIMSIDEAKSFLLVELVEDIFKKTALRLNRLLSFFLFNPTSHSYVV